MSVLLIVSVGVCELKVIVFEFYLKLCFFPWSLTMIKVGKNVTKVKHLTYFELICLGCVI